MHAAAYRTEVSMIRLTRRGRRQACQLWARSPAVRACRLHMMGKRPTNSGMRPKWMRSTCSALCSVSSGSASAPAPLCIRARTCERQNAVSIIKRAMWLRGPSRIGELSVASTMTASHTLLAGGLSLTWRLHASRWQCCTLLWQRCHPALGVTYHIKQLHSAAVCEPQKAGAMCRTGLPKPREAVEVRSATSRSKLTNAPPQMKRMSFVFSCATQSCGVGSCSMMSPSEPKLFSL